jgi:hypothetical protein
LRGCMTQVTASRWELSPSVPKSATPEQCIAAWVDLMNACNQFLLAGLQREIGPDGDLKAADRKWYAEQMEEHDREILHMMREFERRGGGYARLRGVNRRGER